MILNRIYAKQNNEAFVFPQTKTCGRDQINLDVTQQAPNQLYITIFVYISVLKLNNRGSTIPGNNKCVM